MGEKEPQLIRESGFPEFPPRPPDQPIFYPVLKEEDAARSARDRNAKYNAERSAATSRASALRSGFRARCARRTVGGSIHRESWIPAGELSSFNRNIVGLMEVVAEFRAEERAGG